MKNGLFLTMMFISINIGFAQEKQVYQPESDFKNTKEDVINIGTQNSPKSWNINYNFAQNAGTYNEISGGTMLINGTSVMDDVIFQNTPIGFPFYFNGIRYTQLDISTNGFITFGNTHPINTNVYPISNSGAYSGAVSLFGVDLNKKYSDASSEIRYEISGTSPNQIFTLQWKNVKRYHGTTDNLNFQIKLYERTNNISFVYGTCLGTASGPLLFDPQVGLRANSNTYFFNRTTTTNWSATTLGTTNNTTCLISPTIVPVSGLTFTYSPPDIALDAGITAIIEPHSGSTGNYNIVANLKNFGTTTMIACDIHYTVNGIPGAPFSWSGNLPGGASTNVTIANGYNFTTPGYYTIVANSVLAGDLLPINDTTSQTIPLFPTTYPLPFTESFNETTLPHGWLNIQLSGTGLWSVVSAGFYPACTPHSGAAMAHYNSFSYPSGISALLVSPQIDFSPENKTFAFWMYGSSGYQSEHDSLGVYYNSMPDLIGAHFIGNVLRYNPVNGWYPHTYTISATAVGNNYIIFKGYSDFGYDIYLDDVSLITAVGINSFDTDKINIYPNPTKGIIQIENVANSNINIIDVLGNVVAYKENLSGMICFDLSKMAKGMYLVRIVSEEGEGAMIRKVVVE